MKTMRKNIILIVAIVVSVAIIIGAGATAFIIHSSNKKKPNPTPITSSNASGDSVFIGTPNSSLQGTSESTTPSTPSKVESSSSASSEEEPTYTSTRPEKIVKTYPIKDIFKKPTFKRLYYTDKASGKRLPYSLYIPEDYSKNRKYPVLFFLHGAGERGDDDTAINNLEPMFTANSDIVKNAIIISPQCPSNGWWDIDENGNEDGWLGAAWHLLQEIEKTYSCDMDRIYIMGLSMGGYGTWSLLERFGDHFAAGVPICGWGDASKAKALAKIPIWIYHGTADPTVDISSSEEMFNAITGVGGDKIHFTRLDGVDHNAWTPAFKSRELFSWMFAQNKSQNPNGSYQIVPYLKVVDQKGKTIISELDTTFISCTLIDGAEQVELTLNDNGLKKLTNAYKNAKGKNFDLLYGNQKILTFTPKKSPVDNYFYISGIFDSSNYHRYFSRVTSNAEEFGDL